MQHVALVLAGLTSGLTGINPGFQPHIDVRLIAESTAPRPGHTTFVGLQMSPQPGWHGYWSNPGDAGLAPAVKWIAPAGVRFGPLQHPAPTMLKVQGITSFVHAGPYVLISRMSLDRSLQPGSKLPVTAEISWAECSDKLCVPERATLALQLTVGDGAPSADAVTVRHAVAAEPKAIGLGAFEVKDGKLLLQLPPGAELDARHARFFPDENGFFDPAEARVISALPLRIAAPSKSPVPARFSGVVSDGSAAFRVSFQRGELSAPQTEAVRPSPVAPDLARARPTHEEAPALLVHSPAKQRPAASDWARSAEAASAALGLSAAAILVIRRRRGRRA